MAPPDSLTSHNGFNARHDTFIIYQRRFQSYEKKGGMCEAVVRNTKQPQAAV